MDNLLDKENAIPEGYITVPDAAQMLGVSPNAIQAAISRGKIKGAYKAQVTIMIPMQRNIFIIPRESVEGYKRTRERGHTKAERTAKSKTSGRR